MSHKQAYPFKEKHSKRQTYGHAKLVFVTVIPVMPFMPDAPGPSSRSSRLSVAVRVRDKKA